MKLCYYRDPRGNFGDDLNRWLWPRVLPKPLSQCFDAQTLFLGIGTILNDRLPEDPPKKVVYGTGVGYGQLPKVTPDWRFYAVRGPRSARMLGLPASAAVTDAAMLVHNLVPKTPPLHDVAFMPHHRSVAGVDWKAVCGNVGVHYLDPAAPIEGTLRAIAASRLVIAEAMHAAIVADALRIPWIPIRTGPHILEFKWHDWSESMGMQHSFEEWGGGRDPSQRLAELARTGKPRLSRDGDFERALDRLITALRGMVADS